MTYNYNYGYTDPAQEQAVENFLEGAGPVLIVLFLITLLICLAVLVICIVAQCKLFAKAGEKWWKALIPVYNNWVQTRIAGLAWWWFPILAGLSALTIIFNANFVFVMGLFLVSYSYIFNTVKKFGKTSGFAVLTTLLPFIGLPILAFGSSVYDKNAKVDENGIFALEK